MDQSIFARQALTPSGWLSDQRLVISGGVIAALGPAAAPAVGDVVVDALLPGLGNLHSHAFQRAMAGLAEARGPGSDSFWTWRDVMYRFALALTPEEHQAIAAMAYVEMLEAGFTRVGEFHYLHHTADGTPYADPAEMSLHIMAAAEATGIALTHLPVFYAHSDFGGAPPHAGQRRFITTVDGYLKLRDACRRALKRPQDRLGLAPHSLRAATPDEIAALLAAIPQGPVHIHVSEQLREVEDSIAHLGQRPVEWLLSHHEVGARWCLIHATHLTVDERQRLSRSKAVAGLCPITEANLGDGLFPAREHGAAGGVWGVGTDSNVAISAAGELRLLEYGQRLTLRARNVLADGEGSTGAALYRGALCGGVAALAAPPAEIAQGAAADLVGLGDPLSLRDGDRLLDRWIFAHGAHVAEVWASGRHVVSAGVHRERPAIAARFAATLRSILGRV